MTGTSRSSLTGVLVLAFRARRILATARPGFKVAGSLPLALRDSVPPAGRRRSWLSSEVQNHIP